MIDRFDSLRLDAIVRGNHQNYQVSYLCASGSHRAECLVTRRIQESNRSSRSSNTISANMLRDAPGLPCGNFGFAKIIQQRRLAMIDMPHHGNHRGPGNSRQVTGTLIDDQHRLGIIALGRTGFMTHFLNHQHRCILIQHLVDGHHTTHLHKDSDHLSRLYRHRLG